MKKIVLVTQDFYPKEGGISKYLTNICKEYSKKNKVFVIIPDSEKNEKIESYSFKIFRRTFSLFEAGQKREKANKEILNTIEKISPDILLFGYIRAHPETGLEYKKIKPDAEVGVFTHAKEVIFKKAITKNNNFKEKHKGYTKKEAEFYISILNKMDFIFCVSDFTKKLLKKQGIKNNFYKYPPKIEKKDKIDSKKARKKLKINQKDFVLLSVGRLIKRKGQIKVIKAISKMMKKNSNIKYLIVGNGPDKEKIEKIIKKENLEKNIFLYEHIQDKELDIFYSSADIFILPCNFIQPNEVEGFGIVFLEANLFNLPVIGGNKGGVKEAIVDKKTGFLVNPNSKYDIKRKIRILKENPLLRKKLGNNGRKRVINKFILN